MAHRWHTAHGEAFPILRCAIPYFGKRPRTVTAATAASRHLRGVATDFAATAASGGPCRLYGGEQIFARLIVETVRTGAITGHVVLSGRRPKRTTA